MTSAKNTKSKPDDHETALGVLKDISKSFCDPEFADATIKCGDRTWPVVRAILVRQSKWFRAAFSNGMQESQTWEINLCEDNPHYIHLLLKFMHRGSYAVEGSSRKPSVATIERHLEMHRLGDQYDVPRLRTYALKNIETSFAGLNWQAELWEAFTELVWLIESLPIMSDAKTKKAIHQHLCSGFRSKARLVFCIEGPGLAETSKLFSNPELREACATGVRRHLTTATDMTTYLQAVKMVDQTTMRDDTNVREALALGLKRQISSTTTVSVLLEAEESARLSNFWNLRPLFDPLAEAMALRIAQTASADDFLALLRQLDTCPLKNHRVVRKACVKTFARQHYGQVMSTPKLLDSLQRDFSWLAVAVLVELHAAGKRDGRLYQTQCRWRIRQERHACFHLCSACAT